MNQTFTQGLLDFMCLRDGLSRVAGAILLAVSVSHERTRSHLRDALDKNPHSSCPNNTFIHCLSVSYAETPYDCSSVPKKS